MVQDQIKTEADVRRFLLGEMSEDERSAFEAKFVENEDLFEQIRVVEDELIESYVRGTLELSGRERFEKIFLTTKSRRLRVAFTREMLGKLSEYKETDAVKKIETAAANPSAWNSIANFFKTPKLAFGAAFALLVLIFGGWLLTRNPNRNEIVRQITPSPTNQNSPANQSDLENSNTNIAEKIPENKNVSPNANKESQNKNQNTNAPKPESNGAAPILALFAGGVRAGGKTAELNLPENARGANLQVNLESQDYKIYMVEIVDADGNPILKSNNLKAKNSKLFLFIPAAKLRRGDYMVKLSALNAQNETESVADYTFRVNRK
ncbi:MAG: hypothetical protein WA584_13515 [Pyrinomonadaceae bacterium]